jgi:ectoine hydroxylase-related dioxygenase (phytanoyl-CoA dioxygenase family)
MSGYKGSNDNVVRIANTSQNLVVKSKMLPHQSFPKYTWKTSNGNTHIHTDRILMDRRWHSNTLYVRSIREADCDTDHYLVVAKFWESLGENKQAAQNLDV